MALKTQLLIFLAIMALLSVVRGSMRSNFIDFVPSIHNDRVEELTGGDDQSDNHIKPYPSYYNMLEDGKFRGFIKKNTDILSTLERVSTNSGGSVKTVNVKNFGAKGDGKNDDSQVWPN